MIKPVGPWREELKRTTQKEIVDVSSVSLVSEFEQVINEELNAWKKENLRQDKIAKYVRETLNKNRDQILLKLLGFDNRWSDGKWELDHCNGRSGDSIAGDILRQHVAQAVECWIKEQAFHDLPKMADSLKKELQNEFEHEFHKEALKILRQMASQYAAVVASQIFEDKTGVRPGEISEISG